MLKAAMAATASLALAGCMMPASRMPNEAAMMARPVAPMAPASPAHSAPAYSAPAYPAAAAYPAATPGYAPMPAGMTGTTPPFSTAPNFPAAEPPPPAATGIAGLEERKPDLCKAATYRSSIGQPGSAIPGLGITRAYRVVEYRGIEPQNYDPNRVVFRLDAAGNISNIDCG